MGIARIVFTAPVNDCHGIPATCARSLTAVAVACLVLGLAVACSSNAPAPQPAAARAAVVDALAGRPDDLGATARYAQRVYGRSGSTRRLLTQVEGVADFAQSRVEGTLNGDIGNGQPTAAQVFGYGDNVYTRRSGTPQWQKSRRTFELGDPFPEPLVIGRRHQGGEPVYTHQPALRRQIIDAAVTNVVPVGTARLRGADTRHYRVTLDGTVAQKTLPAPVAAELGAWDELPGTLNLDVWVDAEQRLRQVSRFSPLRDNDGFTTELEWWDFGRPPPIAPPADLNDPVATGGLGRTSFDLHSSSKAPNGTSKAGIDEQLSAGEPGVTIMALAVQNVIINVEHRIMGGAGTRHSLTLGIGLPRHASLPQTLHATTIPSPVGDTFTFGDSSASCPTPSVLAGQLTVTELVIDDAGIERFRASMTLTCTTRGTTRAANPTVVTTTADIRFRALG